MRRFDSPCHCNAIASHVHSTVGHEQRRAHALALAVHLPLADCSRADVWHHVQVHDCPTTP